MKNKKHKKKRDKTVLALEIIIYIINPFVLIFVLCAKLFLAVVVGLGVVQRTIYPEDDVRYSLEEFYHGRKNITRKRV